MIEQSTPVPPAAPTTMGMKSLGTAPEPVPGSGPQVTIPGTKISLASGSSAAIGAILATLATAPGIDALARLISALKCTP